MEGFLATKEKELNQKFKSIQNTDKIQEAESKTFKIDDWYDEYYVVSNTFPYNFRASFFVQIIALIEFELKQICNHHHRICKTDVSIRDFRGNSEIEKAKDYLTKICKVDFNNLNPEWQFLQNAKELRNILIHHQGELVLDGSRKANKIIKFIRNKSYMDFQPNESFEHNGETLFSNDGTVIIDKNEANEELLQISEGFFSKLLNEELKYSS